MTADTYSPFVPPLENIDSNRENSQLDLVQEWYDNLVEEWEKWQEIYIGENLNTREILERMGFSDAEVRSCQNEDGGINEEKLFDLFYREAERRAESENNSENIIEQPNVEKKKNSSVLEIEVDRMILAPYGSSEISRGGDRRFEVKEFFPRKENFEGILEELDMEYVKVPMKRRDTLSSEVRKQVDDSMRGKLSDDVERAMYTIYIVPKKDISIFISDLEGEGTHVIFYSPVLDIGDSQENKIKIESFVDELNNKVQVKSAESAYKHLLVRFYDISSWNNRMRTLMKNVDSVRNELGDQENNDKRNSEVLPSEEISQEEWRRLIQKACSYEKFIGMTVMKRNTIFNVKGKRLTALGTIFGISGNLRDNLSQLKFAREVYTEHSEEIDKLISIETRTKEEWIKEFKKGYSFEKYMKMSVVERVGIRIDGKTFSFILSLCDFTNVHRVLTQLEFAKKVYTEHSEEIDKLISIETRTREEWMDRIREVCPYEEYMKMSRKNRDRKLIIDGKKLVGLAQALNLKSNVRVLIGQLKFAREVYAGHTEEIDRLISIETRTKEEWIERIRLVCPFEKYINMTVSERISELEVDGYKMTKLGSLVGLSGFFRSFEAQKKFALVVYPEHKDEIMSANEKSSFLTYEALKEQVRSLGVDSFRKYIEEQKKHPDWPSNPNRDYVGKGWKDWNSLFGSD